MGSLSNEKHEQFCREYIVDLNATQAYLRVYPDSSPKSANANAGRLIVNDSIQQRVAELSKERSERLEITADTVLQGILNIANVDIADAYDENGCLKNIHDIPVNVRKAMTGIKVDELFAGYGENRHKIGESKDVKFEQRLAAWRDLGKHLKLFTDKLEISKDTDNMSDKEIEDRIAELESKLADS